MTAWGNEDKVYRCEGVGCWCPPERTLMRMRYEGHTDDCARARRGWRLNYAHLRGIAYERAVREEIGRQVLASVAPEGNQP